MRIPEMPLLVEDNVVLEFADIIEQEMLGDFLAHARAELGTTHMGLYGLIEYVGNNRVRRTMRHNYGDSSPIDLHEATKRAKHQELVKVGFVAGAVTAYFALSLNRSRRRLPKVTEDGMRAMLRMDPTTTETEEMPDLTLVWQRALMNDRNLDAIIDSYNTMYSIAQPREVIDNVQFGAGFVSHTLNSWIARFN